MYAPRSLFLLGLLLTLPSLSLSAQTPRDTLTVDGNEEATRTTVGAPTLPTPPDSLTQVAGTTLPIERQGFMKKVGKTAKRTGSFVKRFIKEFDSFDTTYVSPNYYNFTAMLQNTNYLQVYRLAGRSQEGLNQSISMKPEPSLKVGPYFGWRWIFLGYTFDISRPRSLGESSEFNLSLYSSMLGCDLLYIQNKGDFRLRKAVGFEGVDPKAVEGMPLKGMDAKTISLSAYYVFNYKHFSYPAAYNQSTVQRISCGSPMIGLGYSKQKVNFDYKSLPEVLLGTPEKEKIIDELKFRKIDYDYYYLSAGYAYNWVFARNWLFGASVMPSVGLRKVKGKKLQGNEVLLDLKNFSFDCTSRAGIVWNNTHWFAGASYIGHLYVYRKDRLSITNSVNYANIYVGFFFNRRKAYRKK